MSDTKTHKITLIPGDGIGPEVTQAVVRILEATGVRFDWEQHAAGAEAFEIFGEYIPQALYESIERNKVALKGRSQHQSAEASRASTSPCARNSTSTPISAPSRTFPAWNRNGPA